MGRAFRAGDTALHEVERFAHLVGEDLAGSRSTDSTRLAVEQFRFERLFDTANTLADRCLRAVDLLAGACAMTICRDLDGSFKVSDNFMLLSMGAPTGRTLVLVLIVRQELAMGVTKQMPSC